MERSVSALAALLLSALNGAAVAGPLEAGAEGSRGLKMETWTAASPEVKPVPTVSAAQGSRVEVPRGLAAAIMATLNDPTLDVRTTVAACYSAEAPPSQEVMDWIEMNLYGGGGDYQLGNRWPGTQGDPTTVTWSFVPDGLSIPNGIGEGVANSELFSRLDAQFSAQGGRATWIGRIQACMDRWSELSGVTHVRVKFQGNEWDDGASWSSSGAANLRGDCRISMKNIDGVNGVLAYNNFPGTGSGGNMVLDRSENWASAGNNNRFMRNIISHEHGHGLGIFHVCPANQSKLMEPFISTAYDGPQHDDIRAVQRLYGDPYEKDDTSVAATDLGTLAAGSTTEPWKVPGGAVNNGSICSIDANGESDWFKFSLAGSATVTVTVAPVGLTYKQGPQDQNCNGGTDFNSLTVADLGVLIMDASGINILAQATLNPIGQAETVAVSLGAGSYFARVLESNTPAQSQLYSIKIDVSKSERIYMAFTNAATIPGVGTVQNEDIVSYDPGSGAWAMVFDGSDVGLSAAAIDAFTIVPGGKNLLLMSFKDPFVLNGLVGGPDGANVDDSDIVQFNPVSLGADTSGGFQFYFDGSDVGLTTNAEDIDAIGFDTNGKLFLSTVGSATGTGAAWTRQDLVEFTETQHGANTAGTFAMLFDGSDVLLADASENIDGATRRSDGTFMLSTSGVFSVTGASGTSQDLLRFTPSLLGDTTGGLFDLYLDLSSLGIDPAENVVGLCMTTEGPQGDIPACVADLTNDESLDVFDFLAFQNYFSAGDLTADFDGDGALTAFDFFEFQNLFNAGC